MPYQTDLSIFNTLTRPTFTKTDKAVRLNTSKQPLHKPRHQTRLLDFTSIVSLHQPPIISLAAVTLTTGHTVQSLYPSEHQDTLSGAARPTSRPPDDFHATIHGRGIPTAPFPAGPQPTRISRRARSARNGFQQRLANGSLPAACEDSEAKGKKSGGGCVYRYTRLACHRDDGPTGLQFHRSYPL